MMDLVFNFAMLPTEFLMKIANGSPILVIFVYPLILLILLGATCFAIIKKRKRWSVPLLMGWLICLPFLFYNFFYMVLWLAMWVCSVTGGGSSCFL